MPRRNPKEPIRPYSYLRGTCDHKRRYGTKAEAESVKEHQELLTLSLSLRIYKCPVPGCGGWHLTRSEQQTG